MTALVASVFLASVVGGLHCAGMCGGLMAFALGGPGQRSATPHALYHGGRLASYAILGGVAGAAGSLLDLGGSLVGLSRVALIVAATLMIGVGIATLLPSLGVRFRCGGATPGAFSRLAARVQGRAIRLPITRRALVMGLATPLLPCGWLYAFVLTAGGTGHPLSAMVVMAVFWAGTLPAMLTLGISVRALAGRLGPKLPVATSLLLVCAGGWTLAARGSLDTAAIVEATVEAPDAVPACCRTGVDQ